MPLEFHLSPLLKCLCLDVIWSAIAQSVFKWVNCSWHPFVCFFFKPVPYITHLLISARPCKSQRHQSLQASLQKSDGSLVPVACQFSPSRLDFLSVSCKHLSALSFPRGAVIASKGWTPRQAWALPWCWKLGGLLQPTCRNYFASVKEIALVWGINATVKH